jgi:hypothetical protein
MSLLIVADRVGMLVFMVAQSSTGHVRRAGHDSLEFCATCQARIEHIEQTTPAAPIEAQYPRGEPGRRLLEAQLRDGLPTLRGRGGRRARLRQMIAAELADSPQAYDLGYARAKETIRIRLRGRWLEALFSHLCCEVGSARDHVRAQQLPSWVEAIAMEAAVLRNRYGFTRGLALGIPAAVNRILAEELDVDERTVRRRRWERVDWWESRRTGKVPLGLGGQMPAWRLYGLGKENGFTASGGLSRAAVSSSSGEPRHP